MKANTLIVDPAGLFQFSGVLDQLRDTARYLVKNPTDAQSGTCALMVDQLDVLREYLKGVISAEVAGTMDVLTPRLDRETADMSAVYFASASLARWIDTLHQTPQFLLSQDVAVANAMKVTEKVEEVLSGAQDSVLALGSAETKELGCYL